MSQGSRTERLRRLRDALTILLANLLVTLGLLASRADPRQSALRVLPPPSPTPAPSATPVRMRVHVSGAVRRPGVVTLSQNARAEDAVMAAGGFAEDADPALVNLAAPLVDGMQLPIPARGEAAVAPRMPVGGGMGSSPAVGAASGSGSGGGAAMASGSSAGPGGAVDLNRASAAELESLPGIGPALASRIVAHREANGPFAQPADLLEVSGIGEKTLARFVDRVVVR